MRRVPIRPRLLSISNSLRGHVSHQVVGLSGRKNRRGLSLYSPCSPTDVRRGCEDCYPHLQAAGELNMSGTRLVEDHLAGFTGRIGTCHVLYKVLTLPLQLR